MATSHTGYLKYLLRHKAFVFVAGLRIGASPWRTLLHDLSKFAVAEWTPYAKYFYGGYGRNQPPDVQRAFDFAWLHHQKKNPHHWQYWVLREDDGATKLLPMPEKYLLEMVADWMGAGRAITGAWNPNPWYEKNAEKILLAPETRARLVKLLARASTEAARLAA